VLTKFGKKVVLLEALDRVLARVAWSHAPLLPVAACWCARTMVLSIIRYWLSRSALARRTPAPRRLHGTSG